jgi:hypothetical protein
LGKPRLEIEVENRLVGRCGAAVFQHEFAPASVTRIAWGQALNMEALRGVIQEVAGILGSADGTSGTDAADRVFRQGGGVGAAEFALVGELAIIGEGPRDGGGDGFLACNLRKPAEADAGVLLDRRQDP